MTTGTARLLACRHLNNSNRAEPRHHPRPNTSAHSVFPPNDNSISPDWNQYLTSVDKIEAASGLDILSALPLGTQTQLQKVVDSGRTR